MDTFSRNRYDISDTIIDTASVTHISLSLFFWCSWQTALLCSEYNSDWINYPSFVASLPIWHTLLQSVCGESYSLTNLPFTCRILQQGVYTGRHHVKKMPYLPQKFIILRQAFIWGRFSPHTAFSSGDVYCILLQISHVILLLVN